MTQFSQTKNNHPNIELDYEVIVIGAGIAGLYQLYKMRELGVKVRLFDR